MPSWPRDPERFQPRAGSDGQLLLFINGILTRPGDQFGWTDRAEGWFLRFRDHDVDSYEYWHTAILSRLFTERRKTRDAAELVRGYCEAWPTAPVLHLVAHSRGCEIARRLIVEHGLQVRSLHLFAGAIEADFYRNGLNAALRSGQLREAYVYTSQSDGILRWIAGASFGLYGRLGYTGPRNVDPEVRRRVWVIQRNGFGHGDWFTPSNFRESMQHIAMAADELPL